MSKLQNSSELRCAQPWPVMDHPRLTRNKESRWITITARQREYAASPPSTTQPRLRGTRESVTRHVTRDTCQQLGAPRDTVFRAVMGGGDIGYGRIFVELYGCTPVTPSYAHFTCHKSHKSVTSRSPRARPGRGTVCPAASVQGAASCSLMVY